MEKEDLIHFIEFLKECEFRIDDDDVMIWVEFPKIEELTDIFGYDYFYDGGIKITLLGDSIAFNLSDILYEKDEDYEIIRKELERWEMK